MSAAAPSLPVRHGRRDSVSEGSLVVRLAAFAGLAAFAAVHWVGFVADPPAGRTVAVVAIAVAAGAALAATARLPASPPARLAVRLAIVAVAFAAALLAVGLRARLLLPGGWDELGDGIGDGITGTRSASWPYAGDDGWLRLTLLLGLPALTIPAAALAFWPARRAAGALRATALALLVVLYAVPVTERDLGEPVGRGALLLLFAAAWLWLPRLRRRDAIPAAVAIGAAAALAIPVAVGLGERDRWVDYERWTLFGEGDRGQSTSFEWTHDYGPIDWSRSGVTLLTVRSPKPHYWKAETLDHFDGLRWRHTSATQAQPVGSELPPNRPARWEERISFNVRALRSQLLVAAGTVHSVDGMLVAESGDGTLELVDRELERGDEYTVRAYVPDPTPTQMRAASPAFADRFLYYTSFELPLLGESALEPESGRSLAGGADTVTSPEPGVEPGADPELRGRLLDSPYRRAYLLARRLAAGRATAYDVVKSVERHLERSYGYSETPPPRDLPLDAFLFRDNAGYCQQFSGAMALLLRMNGIPARVAAGFAPGIQDTTTGEFRVRDMDAHSWVEVYFAGIGWVAFDPTPSATPAALQQDDEEGGGDGAGGSQDDEEGGSAPQAPGVDPATTGGDGSGTAAPWVLGVVLALPLAVLGLVWGVAVVRTRRVRRGGGDPDLRELTWALERLGHPLAPGMTLLALERRLGAVAGPAAAGYARALRERRFAPGGGSRPRLDRRSLRRALTRGRGPRTRIRALLVLRRGARGPGPRRGRPFRRE